MKKRLSLVITLLLSFSLFACSGGNNSKGRLKGINESKVLTLGTSADFAPYEFHTQIDGKDTIVGFDIMIVDEIAKELGVEVEINDTNFDALIPDLQTGKVDIVLSGMNSSEERKKQIDFSKDYYYAEQCVVVHVDNQAELTSIESLAGKKVGAQTGSLQLEFAKEQIADVVGVADGEIFNIKNVQNLGLELSSKKIDALVLDLPVAQAMVRANPQLAITEIPIQGDVSGFAVAIAKENEDLLEIVNTVLDRLESEGKYQEFMDKSSDLLLASN